jgi:hypothetical protein
MKTTTTEDRIEIARYLFRKPGNFKAYFTIYDNIARRENDFVLQVEHFNRETLLSHQHVMVVATFLKKHTMMAPYDLRSAIKAGHGLVTVSDANIKHAINLAVHGMLMVDTKAREYHNPAYTLGGQPPTFWSENETFLQFAKETFPITNDVSNKAKNAMDEHALMRAWKLQKRLGLKFKVTDSLAEYLLFDRNYIYIFHHTSFLKAQLEAFTGDNSPLDLDLEHTLPRYSLCAGSIGNGYLTSY